MKKISIIKLNLNDHHLNLKQFKQTNKKKLKIK